MRIKLRQILLIVSVLFPTQLFAQSPTADRVNELLSTPRRSLHTFLHWQQKGHENEDLYYLPLKLADGDLEEQRELSQQLKKVLDGRGLLVVYDNVPNDSSYVDSLSGVSQYILFPQLPEVYLVKQGDQWLFSQATIDQIPTLYQNTFNSTLEAIVDGMPEILKVHWWGIQLWQYAAVFIWLLIGFIIRRIFEFILENYVRRITQRTSFDWDDKLVSEVQRPAGLIFLGLFFLLTYSNLQLPVGVNYYLKLTSELIVSAGVVWLFYNLSDTLSKYILNITNRTENQLDDQLVPLIRKTLRTFVIIIGVITILQNNGYNVASLIAGLGIGGLAVALAARETLANFFGSITLLLDKPFRIGDWVQIGSVEGIVEEVGFRSTRVRTFYNSLVSVPNSKVSDTAIDNFGLRRYRRLKLNLGLTYSTKPEQMEAFVEGIKALVKSNNNFRQDYYEVHFNSFGSFSLDVLVYVFFDVPDWSTELQQRHNFLLDVMRLANEVGVEFAFPTQTLQIDSVHSDKPRKVGTDKTDDELVSAVYSFGAKGDLNKPDGIQLYKDGEPVDFGSKK